MSKPFVPYAALTLDECRQAVALADAQRDACSLAWAMGQEFDTALHRAYREWAEVASRARAVYRDRLNALPGASAS